MKTDYGSHFIVWLAEGFPLQTVWFYFKTATDYTSYRQINVEVCGHERISDPAEPSRTF